MVVMMDYWAGGRKVGILVQLPHGQNGNVEISCQKAAKQLPNCILCLRMLPASTGYLKAQASTQFRMKPKRLFFR